MPGRCKWILALVAIAGVSLFFVSEFLLAAGLSHGQAEIQARNLWKMADAKRAQGKFEDAIKAYEKSIEILAQSDVHGISSDKTTLGLAPRQMIELCKDMPIDVKKLKDGTYEGTAWGYQAQMTVEITLQSGRIKQFKVKDEKESSPRTALQFVPKAIMARQSCSVDAVSGATCTSYGLMVATQRALDKARETDK